MIDQRGHKSQPPAGWERYSGVGLGGTMKTICFGFLGIMQGLKVMLKSRVLWTPLASWTWEFTLGGADEIYRYMNKP